MGVLLQVFDLLNRRFCILNKIEFYQYVRMRDYKASQITISFVGLSKRGMLVLSCLNHDIEDLWDA